MSVLERFGIGAYSLAQYRRTALRSRDRGPARLSHQRASLRNQEARRRRCWPAPTRASN